jgi:hypothetical protein
VVPADRCSSYEELVVENAELRVMVEGLTARLDVLEAENAELKRRLGVPGPAAEKPTDITAHVVTEAALRAS